MKIGDVVELRSGGVAMTVLAWQAGFAEIGQREGWICTWSNQGGLREAVFPAAALKPYRRPRMAARREAAMPSAATAMPDDTRDA